MRCLWCKNSFSSWHSTRMISHILKCLKGGLGACNCIIPKERYKWYQDFHDQKMKGRREKRGMDVLMTALSKQHDDVIAMLTNNCKK